MEKEKNTLTEVHAVAWDNISMNNHLYWADLNRMLQQAAVNHAEQLGFGFTDISKENISWVLFRMNIQINRLPLLNEEITIVTWPRSISGISASRDFEMTSDDTGETLCKASSDWLIIDLDSRKPQRMDRFTDKDYLHNNKKALSEKPPKTKNRCDFKELFTVKTHYSDLDMNGHVIAHKYFSWLQDAVYKQYGDKEPSFIQMNYFNECDMNEEISIKYCPEDKQSFMGLKLKNGKPAFTAAVVF